MATAPVVVIMWMDPYEQTDFGLNSAVTWHVRYIDRITKVAVDPDLTGMTLNAPLSGTTIPVVPVKDAVGNYHADIALTSVGRWVLTSQPLLGGVNVGSSSMTLQCMDIAA